MSDRKIKRGALSRKDAIFVGGWVPKPMAEAIDRAVRQLDSDRSKFLRRALEEKIAKFTQ
jgi:hypothetical protein